MYQQKGVNLFKLFGFQVKVDWSWVVVAVLVAWSLADRVFPIYYPGFSAGVYWQMGIIGALGLFLSIVAHEFSHSLVARWFGMPIRGITLFMFGGIAEMEDEPPSAKSEFFMALAGPVSSAFIGLVFYAIYVWLGGILPPVITGVVAYVSSINFMLAVFNLMPAFPLDGGRVFRSVLWAWKGRLGWATRVASTVGAGFGFLLMGLGVLFILSGALLTGIWWFFISMFLSNASQVSYQKLLMRKALEGEPVRRFMIANPVVVPSYISIRSLVENYVYKYHFKMYPVVDDGELVGCVTTREVKEIPREEWDRQSLRVILQPCSEENSISVHADAMDALERMHRTGNSRLMVTDGRRLAGVIALKDMLKFLSFKLDLEKDEFEK